MGIRKKVKAEQLSAEALELCNVIFSESPLPRVLLAVGCLDDALGTLLHNFFIKSGVSDDLIYKTGKLLATYDARCSLAYCLGLIDKHLYKNLCTIGEIRNQFGHNRFRLNFDDTDIVQLSMKLSMPEIAQTVIFPPDAEPTFPKLGADPQQRFSLIAVLAFNRLILAATSVNRIRPGQAFEPQSEPPA